MFFVAIFCKIWYIKYVLKNDDLGWNVSIFTKTQIYVRKGVYNYVEIKK